MDGCQSSEALSEMWPLVIYLTSLGQLPHFLTPVQELLRWGGLDRGVVHAEAQIGPA